MKNIPWCIIFLFSLLLPPQVSSPRQKTESPAYLNSWVKQLDELNYLVMKISSLNIIYGLSLSKDQVKKLRDLALQVTSTRPPVPDMTGSTSSEMRHIRIQFQRLYRFLSARKKIPESLQKKIFHLRIRESDIINRSLAGPRRGFAGKRCLKCHVPPSRFPRGKAAGVRTKNYSESERKQIDRAHVVGMLGKAGMMKVWNLRGEVDSLLTNGQRLQLKSFKCCLIPPENLRNPINIGQASATDKWLKFFGEVRGFGKKDWRNVRHFYIQPIKDLIEAQYPGIPGKDKRAILKKAISTIEHARKLDRIDYELKKKDLCILLQDRLNEYFIIRESYAEKEIRLFQSALFLLFPGSEKIYHRMLK